MHLENFIVITEIMKFILLQIYQPSVQCNYYNVHIKFLSFRNLQKNLFVGSYIRKRPCKINRQLLPKLGKKQFKVQDLLPVFLIVHDHLMKARCYTFKDSISLTHFSSVSHFTYTSQKIKSLSLRDSSVNVTKSATFFEKILNGKLYILCSDGCQSFDLPLIYFQIK